MTNSYGNSTLCIASLAGDLDEVTNNRNSATLSTLPRPKVRIFCNSVACTRSILRNNNGTCLVRVEKFVPLSTINCPDCGAVLFTKKVPAPKKTKTNNKSGRSTKVCDEVALLDRRKFVGAGLNMKRKDIFER